MVQEVKVVTKQTLCSMATVAYTFFPAALGKQGSRTSGSKTSLLYRGWFQNTQSYTKKPHGLSLSSELTHLKKLDEVDCL